MVAVTVGVMVQWLILGCSVLDATADDIFPLVPGGVPVGKAIIGRGVCAAVTMNISSALVTLTLLGISAEVGCCGPALAES